MAVEILRRIERVFQGKERPFTTCAAVFLLHSNGLTVAAAPSGERKRNGATHLRQPPWEFENWQDLVTLVLVSIT